jgi:hypothetical protein
MTGYYEKKELPFITICSPLINAVLRIRIRIDFGRLDPGGQK